MTDSERLPDRPGAPPMKLLGLITDAYTDALLRLAYAERDRHDWTSYRMLGYDLIGAGARVLTHACARREQPAGDPRQVAAEVVHELRTTLRLAEHIVGTPASADSTAEEIVALAEDCAQAAGRLYRLSAELSPAALARINPLGQNHDGASHNMANDESSGGEPA
ncbi:hypothetical protein [Amycolatopsis nalaikhensis]|uniref:Uncharacterized protein n=1 Tax=Amycolatopsis nalaikhensis TaxID=715472 RepID=A0ABY8XZ57_9PSEU|nr:hypothetical protein [Amycolatopsis sp. 2-2]WIV60687.1 hypothetical protein QP939_19775 [Amycolatopsis sp. 2-2]